jgi:hypothetical protein
MRNETVVRLRRGLDGARADGRDAVLRGVTGVEEALFGQAIASLPPARAITAILAPALERIGSTAPISEHHVRRLAIGDRNRLLFALHRALYGNRVALVAQCLGPDCGRTLDLDVVIDRLLDQAGDDDAPATSRLQVEIEGRALVVVLRAPNGEDQEAAGEFATDDLARAADLLLRRTILSVTALDGEQADVDALLPALRQPLGEAFAALDPEAEIVLRLECPECGHLTPADLDPYDLFRSRALESSDVLVDVDRIARAYHWSEAEIMALPVSRRRRYLAMIEAAGEQA